MDFNYVGGFGLSVGGLWLPVDGFSLSVDWLWMPVYCGWFVTGCGWILTTCEWVVGLWLPMLYGWVVTEWMYCSGRVARHCNVVCSRASQNVMAYNMFAVFLCSQSFLNLNYHKKNFSNWKYSFTALLLEDWEFYFWRYLIWIVVGLAIFSWLIKMPSDINNPITES